MRKDRAGPLIPVLCALVESFARTGNFAKGRAGGTVRKPVPEWRSRRPGPQALFRPHFSGDWGIEGVSRAREN